MFDFFGGAGPKMDGTVWFLDQGWTVVLPGTYGWVGSVVGDHELGPYGLWDLGLTAKDHFAGDCRNLGCFFFIKKKIQSPSKILSSPT